MFFHYDFEIKITWRTHSYGRSINHWPIQLISHNNISYKYHNFLLAKFHFVPVREVSENVWVVGGSLDSMFFVCFICGHCKFWSKDLCQSLDAQAPYCETLYSRGFKSVLGAYPRQHILYFSLIVYLLIQLISSLVQIARPELGT